MTEIVEQHLTGMQLHFEQEVDDQDRHSFYFDMKLKMGVIRGVVGINYPEEYVLIYFLNPTPFPEDRKNQIGEYLHRVNFNIPQGAFVIDYNDLIIGFHTTFSITADDSYNEEMFIDGFKFCKELLEGYYPGVLKVGYGEKEPEVVLDEILLRLS